MDEGCPSHLCDLHRRTDGWPLHAPLTSYAWRFHACRNIGLSVAAECDDVREGWAAHLVAPEGAQAGTHPETSTLSKSPETCSTHPVGMATETPLPEQFSPLWKTSSPTHSAPASEQLHVVQERLSATFWWRASRSRRGAARSRSVAAKTLGWTLGLADGQQIRPARVRVVAVRQRVRCASVACSKLNATGVFRSRAGS